MRPKTRAAPTFSSAEAPRKRIRHAASAAYASSRRSSSNQACATTPAQSVAQSAPLPWIVRARRRAVAPMRSASSALPSRIATLAAAAAATRASSPRPVRVARAAGAL
ncbi:hypothetical protein D3C87_1186100 [compost metagenome]